MPINDHNMKQIAKQEREEIASLMHGIEQIIGIPYSEATIPGLVAILKSLQELQKVKSKDLAEVFTAAYLAWRKDAPKP